MKTAEEILKKHFAITTVIQPSLKLVLLAMEEYASQFKPNIESLEERKTKFVNRVAELKAEYDRPMLVDFVNYWLEISDNGKKYRFEKEKVFDVKKRLVRWSKNSKQNNGKGHNVSGAEQLANKILSGELS